MNGIVRFETSLQKIIVRSAANWRKRRGAFRTRSFTGHGHFPLPSSTPWPKTSLQPR